MAADVTTRWTVVIPVKGATGKSRLGAHDDGRLALAIALDTVEAALAAVATVIVVTAEGERFTGATIVPDPGAGLGAAIEAGVAAADPDSGVAVLLGDLPGMRPEELVAALKAAAGHPRSFVADADGTGTVLASARGGETHELAFGPGSRAAHAAAGYVELDGDWPGLKRDVDLPEHLDGLDLGPRTRRELERLGFAHGPS